MTCIFCNIISNKTPANIVFETQELIVIHDTKPQSPTHLLILPKKHIATLNEAEHDDIELLGHMILTAQKLASSAGIDDSGYRLIFNVNAHGGQTVYHIHLHLLGGRPLTWPPG